MMFVLYWCASGDSADWPLCKLGLHNVLCAFHYNCVVPHWAHLCLRRLWHSFFWCSVSQRLSQIALIPLAHKSASRISDAILQLRRLSLPSVQQTSKVDKRRLLHHTRHLLTVWLGCLLRAGRVLGALNGMQMMAWGLGPMIFNNIFAWLIDKQAMAAFAERFGWQPPVSLVWYIGVLLSIIAIALAFSIPDPRTVTVDVRPASAVKPEPVQNSEEWDNKIGRNTSAHNKVAKPAGPPAGARLCDQLMWRMQCKTDHTRARRMSDRVGLLQ